MDNGFKLKDKIILKYNSKSLPYFCLLDMKLSIIIINYNTPEVTSNCLKSIEKYRKTFNFNFEIILIDNAPTIDYKFEFDFPQIVYLRTEENIGFGRANNLGMKLAKGEFFLLLNSDTLLVDDSLNNCISYMSESKNASVGLVGSKLLNSDMSYQHSYYPFVKNSLLSYFKANNPILNKLFKINQYFIERYEPTQVGDISGAFMLLRKEVFEKTKGFDPDFFLYCEETEWCRNRISKNYKIVYLPDTRIIHLGGQSAPKEMMAVQASISEFLFWYKCGLLKFFGYIFINTINIITQVAIWPIVKSENRIPFKKLLKHYFIGLYYAIFDIPKYSKNFGGRSKPLYYKAAEYIFFRQLSI